MTTEYIGEKELAYVLRFLTYENELVMRVCLHTGLRVGDVVRFRNPVKRQFWIVEQKTGKKRRVNLTQDLVNALNKNGGRSQYVFPGRLDPLASHRTRQAVWADIKRAQRALRLPENLGTHSARKIFAARKLESSDIYATQKALNHDDAATTLIYAMAAEAYAKKYVAGDGNRSRRRRRH